jgi:hypothetical protein
MAGIPIRAEPYRHFIIRSKNSITGIMYHRYWGAIGDFYYFLSFIGPLLKANQDKLQVLAADTYNRYGNDPLMELCQLNGLIDELWTHPRKRGGPTLMPPEFVKQATNPDGNNTVYVPSLYYDKYLTGPGVQPYPVEMLREASLMHPKYLVPIQPWDKVHKWFPQLHNKYVTIHLHTIGKKRNNLVPLNLLQELNKIGVQFVCMKFPTDSHLVSRPMFDYVQKLSNFITISVNGPAESLAIQSHSSCHTGIESSQLMAAGILDIQSYFLPYTDGWKAFIYDLNVGSLWTPVPWDDPVYVRELIENELGNG